jgi:hypothetical protein
MASIPIVVLRVFFTALLASKDSLVGVEGRVHGVHVTLPFLHLGMKEFAPAKWESYCNA